MVDTVKEEAVALFKETYGSEPTHGAFAPGRVNLIGEHTDYNDGFVFPMALHDKVCVLVGRKTDSDRCRVVTSAAVDGECRYEFPTPSPTNPLTPAVEAKWYSYFLGVVAGFDQNRGNIPAFDVAISTSVPLGGGLSSSASLEVATFTFLEELCPDLKSTDLTAKALACQKAEHDYAHVPCGVMDQFIATMGRQGNALLIDCRAPPTGELVPFNDPDTVIVVTNSNIKHALGSSEYPKRRATCEQAAKVLEKPALRDCDLQLLESFKSQLSDLQYRRARHVITECKRTMDAVAALRANDMATFGRLMYESHESLRADYEVSCGELDHLVALAKEVDGVYGARMTGGGFGGCTVTLVRKDGVDALIKHIKQGYPENRATCFVTTAGAGTAAISL
ncbi:galactokinase-like [Sycon ciliatum]|uniref:galactokinase-like n=1 Tax=Sycon ciliatum TaxID=27933 RepID=UPI0031F60340